MRIDVLDSGYVELIETWGRGAVLRVLIQLARSRPAALANRALGVA